MTDKAVSTEDLVIEIPRNANLDAARLEAVIKTLVEGKAEALKNNKRKSSSITSSPKLLINKLRGTSTSTVSSKDKDEPSTTQSQTSRLKCGCQDNSRKDSRICQKCGTRNYQRTSSLTPTRSMKHSKVHHCDRILHFSEEDGNSESFLQRSQECGASTLDCSEVCYCRREPNGEIRMHFDDDYISLKIEDCEDLDWDEAAARRSLRRAQRKKRRRRKRRMKKQMAISAMAIPVVSEEYKDLDSDELSQRARWTIVVTACLLLFMCLLLVGITLRMAPIIDDMVENDVRFRTLANSTMISSSSFLNPFAEEIVHNMTEYPMLAPSPTLQETALENFSQGQNVSQWETSLPQTQSFKAISVPSTDQVAGPKKEVSELDKKLSEPAKKVTEPTKKMTEPAKKVTEPAKKVTEPAKKVTDPAKKVTEPTKKVTEPAKKVIQLPKNVTNTIPKQRQSEPAKKTSTSAPKKPAERAKKTSAVVPKGTATPTKVTNSVVAKKPSVEPKKVTNAPLKVIQPVNKATGTTKKVAESKKTVAASTKKLASTQKEVPVPREVIASMQKNMTTIQRQMAGLQNKMITVQSKITSLSQPNGISRKSLPKKK